MRFNNLPEDTNLTGTEILPSTDVEGDDKKVKLTTLAEYIITKATASLSGATQTVKAAIDALKSAVDSNTTDISTNKTNIATNASDISTLNTNLANLSNVVNMSNCKAVWVTKTITIPAGATTQVDMDVDFSEELKGVTGSVVGALFLLNAFLLPYSANGNVLTWVSHVYGTKRVSLHNRTSAWNNYTMYAVFILSK